MRLLVCGGRNFSDIDRLRFCMNQIVGNETDVTVIHGGARGADRLAGQIALRAGVKVSVFFAQWETYGKAAGSLRNQQMLDEGKPDVVLAMPGGRGTADMVRRAKAAGVKVVEVEA